MSVVLNHPAPTAPYYPPMGVPGAPSSQPYPVEPPGVGILDGYPEKAGLLPPGNRKCGQEECVTCAWIIQVRSDEY